MRERRRRQSGEEVSDLSKNGFSNPTGPLRRRT
jgi:hypothetical protein